MLDLMPRFPARMISHRQVKLVPMSAITCNSLTCTSATVLRGRWRQAATLEPASEFTIYEAAALNPRAGLQVLMFYGEAEACDSHSLMEIRVTH